MSRPRPLPPIPPPTVGEASAFFLLIAFLFGVSFIIERAAVRHVPRPTAIETADTDGD